MNEAARGPVLLTGASGFVGAAVMRALISAGYDVRALVRSPGSFSPPPGVTTCPGDITDLGSTIDAARGCASVIHCAADYRLSLRRADAGRMIAGKVCTERDGATSPATLAGPYKRSKWAAERLVLGQASAGLEVVVVQPSTPLGVGDHRPTPTGQTIRDFLGGRIPAVVDTGMNLVAVDAVARGHLLALERGKPGRSYILGDRNLTLRRFLSRVAEIAGLPPPRWRVPLEVALAVAASSETWGWVQGRPPAISMTSVRMAAHPMYVDAARAREELGWEPGDLDAALVAAVNEFDPANKAPAA